MFSVYRKAQNLSSDTLVFYNFFMKMENNAEKLKTELREAIECEKFERAAQLRDEIRAIEGGEGK